MRLAESQPSDEVDELQSVGPVDDDTDSSISRLRESDPTQRWQDTSSWMTSFILHLTCFLLITSISAPWAADGGPGSREALTLTMGFSESNHDTDGVSPSVSLKPSPETDSSELDSDTPAEKPTRPQPAPQQQQPQPARARRNVQKQAKRRPKTMYGRWVAQRMTEPVVRDSSSQYAAILNRKRSDERPRTVPSQLETAVVASAEILNAEQIQFDKIVDDFIQYDIGQLRGKAGQAARRRFMSLGEDSIPALVRGLNKSAGIHASCPVGVIAGKLIQTLRGAQDSSLRQYAVNNIGRGVAEDAPHFHRIMALRRRWLGNANEVPEAVAAIVSQQTMRDDGHLVELVLAIQDSPIDTMVAALDSGDTSLCNAALIAITQGRGPLSPDQSSKLVATLMRIAQSPTSEQQASLVEEALSSVRSRR